MNEAVKTSTSTFGIWAIIVVAMVCLAVWLVGISVADNVQARESRRWWRRLHASASASAGAGLAEAATEPIPAQRTEEPPTRPDLPAQRGGDADRAERSLAGPDPARRDEEPPRS
jgi:hypothetical protein